MAQIVCIGLNPALDTTLELDELMIGQVNRCTISQTHPAGKALNVASLLSQLGHEVAMTGFLGQDNAQGFVECFDELRIDNQVVMVEGGTRQNIKIAECDGRMTDINGIGFLVDNTAKEQLYQRLSVLIDKADFVVVSGSLPVGFDTDDFEQLLTLIKQSKAKLVVDTSAQALKIACNHQPFLIKPNSQEVSEAFLMAAQHADEQARFVRQLFGVCHVVISMGEQGVNWWHTNQNQELTALHANPPKVTPKSTVGAGDTLLAGMIHGLAKSNDAHLILTQATAMAAHTVSVVGVEVADKKRYQDLTAQITISPINL